MPHVVVKMWPGRTEAQKKRCAKLVSEAVMEAIGVEAEKMSVSIMEIPESEWDAKINGVDRVDPDAVLYIPKDSKQETW